MARGLRTSYGQSVRISSNEACKTYIELARLPFHRPKSPCLQVISPNECVRFPQYRTYFGRPRSPRGTFSGLSIWELQSHTLAVASQLRLSLNGFAMREVGAILQPRGRPREWKCERTHDCGGWSTRVSSYALALR